MKIKEIILEGFKSYQGRTIISNFDQSFNAITGLNGSGKSNIMDGILFVLGLTKNLDMMRVQKLQELVYKSGHAGVTKAEVTITFDNTDKSNSPSGYEDCGQIRVTRTIQQEKSKYFVNGQIKPQKSVKDMFRNIQLNIENPHFYVAQGRITRIINLNSKELIMMLEETAGTSLYNKKKEECLNLMAKKEESLKEIQSLMDEEITPQFERLHRDREEYQVFQSGQQELLRLEKMLLSYEYYDSKKKIMDSTARQDSMQQQLQFSQDELRNVQEIMQKIMQKIEKNKKLHSNEEKYQKIINEFNVLKHKQKKEENEINNRKKQIGDITQEIIEYKQKLSEAQGNILRNKSKQDYQVFQAKEIEQIEKQLLDFKELQDDYKTRQNDDKIDNLVEGIENQLNMSKKSLAQTTSEIHQIQGRMAKYSNEIRVLSQNLGNQNVRQSEITQLEKEANQLENEINQSKFDEHAMSQLKNNLNQIDNEIMTAEHRLNDFFRQGYNHQLNNLEYRNPEPNFDRKKVRGKLFQLFSIKDNRYTQALEIGAGGKLQNIVVENQFVSQALLKNKCFGNQHVSLIPNNKVNSKLISIDVINQAQKIAQQYGGQAISPMEVVQYNIDIEKSIQFAFGGFIIVSSNEIGKAIANQSNFKMRQKCVTLDGEVFDPSGSITGGYINNSNMILQKMHQVNEMKREIQQMRDQQAQIRQQYENMNKDLNYFDGLRNDLNEKKYKLERLQAEAIRKSGPSLEERKINLENQMQDEQENLAKVQIVQKTYQNEINHLEGEMKNIQGNKGQNIKDLVGAKLKKLKDDIKNSEKNLKMSKTELSRLEVEQDTLQQVIPDSERKIAQLQKDIDKIKQNNSTQERAKAEIDSQLTIVAKKKDEMEFQMREQNHEMKNLEEERKNRQQEIEKLDEDVKKLTKKLEKFSSDLKLLKEQVKKLSDKNPDLEKDFSSFGVQGGEFDFTNFNYNQQQKEYEEKKHSQEKKQKEINFKVEANIDDMDRKYNELKKNKNEVEKDKKDILHNMQELDKKKQETLEKAYLFVNQKFGNIFSDLLKGASAKISKIDGKEVSEGIELSVKFSGKWKNSLTELSGGQRSLLALSFVLALLLYKPAPFYILDEVDAALDLSHTENIDGMYQNANVLYKTSIIDGSSKIERFDFNGKKKNKQQ